MKIIQVEYRGWGESWRVGRLADNGRQTLFEFDQEALSRGLELSPLRMPLRPEPYGEFPDFQMRLPGFIADSLPDGWGLLLMDRYFRRLGQKEISSLDRLAFLGDRAIGALVFSPPAVTEPVEELTLRKIAQEAHKITEDKASSALSQLALLGGSPQGARPKVLVNYNPETKVISTGPGGAGEPWLVKFQAAGEHKEVSAVESLYAELARAAGVEMEKTEYFDLSPKLSAFGTKRFDREGGLRVPVHTLAGALHANFRVPLVDYVTFLRLVLHMTKDEREVYRAFRRCVFNVVFHNRDDHPKNFSFRLGRKGEWKLSPAYDLTFSSGPGGDHQMDICGEGQAPGLEHLRRLAEEAGLDQKKCLSMVEAVKAVAGGFAKTAGSYPIRKATVTLIEGKIRESLKALT